MSVYTRSSDREDVLIVHPDQGTWLMSRRDNVLQPNSMKMVTLAEGRFQPTQAASSGDLQIKPVNGEWRFNAKIIAAAAEHSPLLSTALAHLQQLSDQERAVVYMDGHVISKETKGISRLSIITNPGGVTIVKIYTRSTDQEDMLVVHPGHGRWEMSRTRNVLEPNSRTIVTLAKGEFPPTP